MLKIIKVEPIKKTGSETVHDANDFFSSFPNAKTEQRAPTQDERISRRERNAKRLPQKKQKSD